MPPGLPSLRPLIDSIFTQLYLCSTLLAAFLVTWSCLPHASTTQRGITTSCKTGSGPSVKTLILFAQSLRPLPLPQAQPVQQALYSLHPSSLVHRPHSHLQLYLHLVPQPRSHLYPHEHPLHPVSKDRDHYLELPRLNKTNKTKIRVG